jgi:hypothetical protein
MFEFISKKFADIKILHEGYTADYFLDRMKTNALHISNPFYPKFYSRVITITRSNDYRSRLRPVPQSVSLWVVKPPLHAP